jgi:hypothetical protein
MSEPTAPDFVKRQFIGERGGSHALLREMADSMKARGATWVRATVLGEKDQIVMEGWLARPADDGPPPLA